MKKLMAMMLGLSILVGSTALFGEETKDTGKKEKPAKKGKKSKKTDSSVAH